MKVSVWKGGTYGIRVGHKNVHAYFKKSWKKIEVKIDSKFYIFSLSNTFWTTCPEFRGYPLPNWLKKKSLNK